MLVTSGSSPRVRGSRGRRCTRRPSRGIIPAGAGLTLPLQPGRSARWDHPRGCGAHSNTFTRTTGAMGSSPRVRGSQSRPKHITTDIGIIPAGAGLTTTSSTHLPRSSGSSPRVRGSRLPCLALTSHTGIIPAGAGLTTALPELHRDSRDHPRGCGAHRTRRWPVVEQQGSSPRVRGSRRSAAGPQSRPGIIPAGAGLTRWLCVNAGCLWDHPRGCGAHQELHDLADIFLGSSPRVRGSRRG